MKLPESTIISGEKITDYLLKWQPDNDKSQFLAGLVIRWRPNGYRRCLRNGGSERLPVLRGQVENKDH